MLLSVTYTNKFSNIVPIALDHSQKDIVHVNLHLRHVFVLAHYCDFVQDLKLGDLRFLEDFLLSLLHNHCGIILVHAGLLWLGITFEGDTQPDAEVYADLVETCLLHNRCIEDFFVLFDIEIS